MPTAVSFAVCVCTRNRPEDLRRCLDSIATAEARPEQMIVSDDGDEGKRVEQLCSLFGFVKYQQGPRKGLGANRNACLASVTASHVLFFDDDVVVPATFFTLARQLCDQNAGEICTAILSGLEYKHVLGEVHRIEPGNADFWGFQRLPPNGKYEAVVINAAVFPASLFNQARFDPLLRYGCEEIDMVHHAIACGYRVIYAPELFVDHYPSPINRDEYAGVAEASRLYATAKDYWAYQKKPWKAVLFSLLAPPKLLIALARRSGLKGVSHAFSATALATSYVIASGRSGNSAI